MGPDTGAPFCARCGWQRNASASSILHLPLGTQLHDCYLVGRVLGQGGFGITYIGWDTRLHRKVAIKEYFPQVIASRMPGSSTVAPSSSNSQADFEHGLQSFMSEGRILARFSDHPCIVSVLNLFEANHTGYLVMGYLDGMTLGQSLAQAGGKLYYDVAREIMMRVMDGLREVHSQGLLHRDISPDNIYLTRQGPVKILDFGAARFEVSERSQSLSVVLKEGYAPEEQYRRNGAQGPWTDVYATAATLYRAITGVVPPPALDRLHADTLKSPRELGVVMPAADEKALLRALSVKAGDRFQSMESFQQALPVKKVVEPPRPDPVGIPKWVWVSLVLVVVLIAGLLIYHKVEQDKIAEAQRQEAARQQAIAAQAAAAAAAAQQAAADAERKKQAALTEAQSFKARYDAWLDSRRQAMAPKVVTVTVKNDCAVPLYLAIRFKVPDDTGHWVTSGWTEVPAGETRSPHMATANGMVYFWAREDNGNWDGSNDSKATQTEVVSNNFIHEDGSELQGDNKRTVSMFHEYFDSWGDHVERFSCNGK
jgi:serine/threonine protein kinase